MDENILYIEEIKEQQEELLENEHRHTLQPRKSKYHS